MSLTELLYDDGATVHGTDEVTILPIKQNITDVVLITTVAFGQSLSTEFWFAIQVLEVDAKLRPEKNDLVLNICLDAQYPQVLLLAELDLRTEPSIEGGSLWVKHRSLLRFVFGEHSEREHVAAIYTTGDQFVPV